LNRSGGTGFDANVYFDVAAMDALADELAETEFIEIEAFREANFQVEKTVIDAFNADAQIPTESVALGLGVTGHGEDFSFFGLHCALFAHVGFLVDDGEGSGSKVVDADTGAVTSS
jgi:hypothetical protein